MALSSGNSFQNTKKGCEWKETLPFNGEYEANASFQGFEGDSDYWKNSLPVGYRFKPKDEELLGYYLRMKKVGGGIIYDNIIKDLDIYKYEPLQLQNFAYDHGDGKKYFYTPLHKKYDKGSRAKRDCPGGFWKMSQKPKHLNDGNGNIGTKTPLAFYTTKKNPKGVKTQWLMQQYRFTDTKQTEEPNKLLDEYVLCKVYYKKKSGKSCDGDDQSSMPSKEGSSQSQFISSPPSPCSNYVSCPLQEQYQNPNYTPNISSYNNSEMASCSNPKYTSCPNPTSNPFISIKPPISAPSHYASSSKHGPAMHMPFSNSRPSTSSHPNFHATTNSTMHTPNSYHTTQQLNMSHSRASFNPKFDMNPSFTQNSYQPFDSNFYGSNISPMPSIGCYTYWDPIHDYNTIQNTGQCYIGNPYQMNHYSDLGTTINAEQYSYTNPSPLIPLSSIITNMDNSMNPNHGVNPNPITYIPYPGANLSMNYSTHPTINISGPSPSPNLSADSSMRIIANLDLSGLNNQQEPSFRRMK